LSVVRQQLDASIIRPAVPADVPVIYELVRHYAERGNLLPRSEAELHKALNDFYVADIDGLVVGCGALEIFTAELGEVRSLVVADEYLGQGLGTVLVKFLMELARGKGLKRLMALTYAPGFFHRLGFITVPRDTLPEKVWGICIKCYKYQHCDEIAVLTKL